MSKRPTSDTACGTDAPLPRWSAADRFFADLGVHDSAYVKPVLLDGRKAVAVHAADGRLLDHFSSVELASAILRQEDLEPLRVH
ncbi:hypothetical protein [Azospirillum agricola]|uniref:hypothetical protein n=1 Tax=Azospirillum agricola TaxID=1720247 RepID=UPI000A0F21BE|nr:hypothetical protein [Azospirillum agricola]MBP2228974.1 hypothetical protein [Azospirillum agricola]SMH61968.1 hypothetical protein SAMN02982994_6074 [Azospirillum lipoferum]